MRGEVLLVEGVVVHLDLGEGAEVVRHQHHRDLNVLKLADLRLGIDAFGSTIWLKQCFWEGKLKAGKVE